MLNDLIISKLRNLISLSPIPPDTNAYKGTPIEKELPEILVYLNYGGKY